jgi:energy-coupling factor transporter ATP-binding protein EcfA2
MSVIKVSNLTYTYLGSEKPTLKEINLVIDKGEFVILTGPSGCGKTTFCRCFNGLIPHFYGGDLKGDVVVSGLAVRDHPTSELSQYVGFVFQNPENQLFALSVEKDVAFGLENLGLERDEIRRRVEWALDMTEITHLRESAPYELSGGQQQRVAIASVLAMQPEVIVLDEPTSFLDPLSAKKIFEVVSRLNTELKITIILVEHRLDLAVMYANRVIVMDGGRIILSGHPREVFNSEKAYLTGVGIPKTIRLFQLLREDGIELAYVPITPDETAQLIREALKL